MSFAKGSEDGSKRWDHYLITVMVTFLGLLGGSSIGLKLNESLGIGPENSGGWLGFAVQLFPFLTALAAFFFCLHFIHGTPIRSVITFRKKFDFKRFFAAFAIWFAILLSFMFIAIGMGAPVKLRWDPEKLFPLIAVSAILLPLQTAFEDIIYRGYLFQGVTNAIGKAGLSVLVLGCIFGWMHAGNPEVKLFGNGLVLFYVISGLFMGILAHLDDGLELGMGYHFANNFFAAVVLTNSWQVFQTDALFLDKSDPYFGWENWATLFLVQPFLLFLFYKMYRWKSPLKKIRE